MENRLNKKGDITTTQIIVLIILITSFIVILLFLFRLNLGKTSDKEICHNSVIMRGSSVLPKESIPLNCQTNYLCITQDGSCEKMSGTYETKKVKIKEEVYEILANEMADCWWTFGEGKLNYVGKDFQSDLYCSICSQISFDNSLEIFENKEIDEQSFYNYLANNKISGKDISYLDYLVGLKSSKDIEESLQTANYGFRKLSIEKQYFIIMGILSQAGVENWVGAGVGIGMIGGGILLGPLGIIVGGAIGGGGGYILGTAVQGESGNHYLAPTIIEANSEDFAKLRCGSIKTLA